MAAPLYHYVNVNNRGAIKGETDVPGELASSQPTIQNCKVGWEIIITCDGLLLR